MDSVDKNHVKALEAATRATTTKYHLAYYSGVGKDLSRVGGAPKK